MDNQQKDIAYFLSFCIEQYKVSKGLTGEETVAIFNRYGVLAYLSDCYEALHTQGGQWIVGEIDEFIAERERA